MRRSMIILTILVLACILMTGMACAGTGVSADDPIEAVITLKSTSEVFSGATHYPEVASIKVGGIDVPVDSITGRTWSKLIGVEPDGSHKYEVVTNIHDADTYYGTITGKFKQSDNITDTYYKGTVQYTVTQLLVGNDADNRYTEIKYGGKDNMDEYPGFATLKNDIEVGEEQGFDPATVTIYKAGSTDVIVPSNLYTVKALKEDTFTLRILVEWREEDLQKQNIVGGDRFKDIPLYVSLEGNYQIAAIPDQTFKGFKYDSKTDSFLTTAITPTVKVDAIDSSSVPKISSKDYDVTYTNNIYGSSYAHVTVTGKGNFRGSIDASFYIVGKALPSFSVKAVVQGQVPEIVISDSKYTLVNGLDYEVLHNDSTIIGKKTGKITVVGKGNYAGTKVANYEVLAPSATIYQDNVTVTDLELYYNGEVQVLNPVVMVDEDGDGLDKDDVLTPGTDYTLSYTHTETNVTSTAPVNSGTYKVYVTKSQNYKISGTVYAGTLKIKPIPLDWTEIVFGDTNIIYEGKYVPKVKLRHAQEEFYFVEDVDYTVSYVNLLSNSVYTPSTVVVTPKAGGNLTTVGSSITELRQPFSIGTRSILNDCLSYFTDNENSRLYDGTNFKPTVYVRDIALNKILTQDVHYTVSYRDSDGKLVSSLNKTGDYTVIITGIGEYSGTDKLTFKIFGTDISKYKVNLYEYSVMANGSARTPIITSVTLGSIATLNASNYSVSYKDPFGNPVSLLRSPGTYKVVVTGRGSYEGSTSAEFRIIGTPQKIAMTKTSYKVYKSTKPFTLSALSSGDTTGYHYESSNPAVASVTQAGTVTIHKLGRAKITVTTTGMFFSDPASTNVYIKVHPNKTTLSKKPWTDGKGNFRVRWKTQKDVDLYQIRYSTSSKFKSYKTKTVTASELYATQSTKISGLKSGKKYYVKVRAVKLVKNDAGDELKYYGKWSGWKSVVTK